MPPVSIPFYVVDAFTNIPFAGNPAGVFIDSDARLTSEQMKQLAGEVRLESAFVLPPTPDAPQADFRLRYFTGLTEVPLCGHDTVATLVALHHSGRIALDASTNRRMFQVQTNIGVLRVEVSQSNKTEGEYSVIWVTLHQNAPGFLPPFPALLADSFLAALGASAWKIPRLPVQFVSTGTPWIFVPVVHRAFVDKVTADLNAIVKLSKRTGTFGVYIFAIEHDEENRPQIWSRCFAPIAGLNEDPVTGSASGALGCYLAQHGVLNVAPGETAHVTAQQGFAGGRGGVAQISVTRDESGVLHASVTGEAVVVAEGVFRL